MNKNRAALQGQIFRDALENRLAEMEEYRRRDFPRVGRLAQEAMVYAEQLGDFHGYTRAMTFAGWAAVNMNQFEDALTTGCEALILARTHGFLDIEVFVLDVLAIGFASIGATEESLSLFRHMLAGAERLADAELIFMARHDLAVTLLNSGQPETGISIFELAVRDMPPRIAESPDASLLYANLSQMHVQFGHPDKAFGPAEKSLRIAQAARDDVGIGRACVALSLACSSRGDFAQAELYLHQGRMLADADATGHVRFNLYFAEGQFYANSGRLAESAEAVERAYWMAIESNMLNAAYGQLEMLRQLYEDIGDKERLLDTYKRLSEDLPKLQQQSGDIRLKILQMVFAADKAAVKAELNLSQQKNAVMERLSQEFRAPLDVIQSMSEIIDRQGDRLPVDQRRDALRQITAQVGTMRVILDDIVELLQPEEFSGTAAAPEQFTLLKLSESVQDELKRYRLDGMRIVTHLPLQSAQVTAPLRAVRTVTVHLLSNALKFSKEPVDLTLSVDADWLVVSVKDRGIGIPAAEQQSIFQPLYRASNFGGASGYGLGLAIVSKELALIGGQIDLDSTTEIGTTVTVRVPLKSAA